MASIRWKKSEMDSVITKYVEENEELSQNILQDPDNPLPTYRTVLNRYGGLKECVEELGLEDCVEIGRSEGTYSRDDIIDAIKENSVAGIAPKHNNDNIPCKDTFTRFFGGYLNAVWMAEKKPQESWYKNSKDSSKERESDLRHLTRELYWDDEEKYETNFDGEGRYLNPTTDELPFNVGSEKLEEIGNPKVRITANGRSIDRETQDQIMDIVQKSETYMDMYNRLENRDITERRALEALDPEEENGFGRWMTRENSERVEEEFNPANREMPENIEPMFRTRKHL